MPQSKKLRLLCLLAFLLISIARASVASRILRDEGYVDPLYSVLAHNAAENRKEVDKLFGKGRTELYTMELATFRRIMVGPRNFNMLAMFGKKSEFYNGFKSPDGIIQKLISYLNTERDQIIENDIYAVAVFMDDSQHDSSREITLYFIPKTPSPLNHHEERIGSPYYPIFIYPNIKRFVKKMLGPENKTHATLPIKMNIIAGSYCAFALLLFLIAVKPGVVQYAYKLKKPIFSLINAHVMVLTSGDMKGIIESLVNYRYNIAKILTACTHVYHGSKPIEIFTIMFLCTVVASLFTRMKI